MLVLNMFPTIMIIIEYIAKSIRIIDILSTRKFISSFSNTIMTNHGMKINRMNTYNEIKFNQHLINILFVPIEILIKHI